MSGYRRRLEWTRFESQRRERPRGNVDREHGPLGWGSSCTIAANRIRSAHTTGADDWTYEANAQIAKTPDADGFDFFFRSPMEGLRGKTETSALRRNDDLGGRAARDPVWGGGNERITGLLNVT